MLGSWSGREREVVIAGLLALLESVFVGPMTNLAWRMGQLVHEHIGLPMLGSEVVAAVERLGALLSRRATMALESEMLVLHSRLDTGRWTDSPSSEGDSRRDRGVTASLSGDPLEESAGRVWVRSFLERL